MISRSVAPYLLLIDQLKAKQLEKEAEIVVMKYAILEMDRKFQELDKRCKANNTAVIGGGKIVGRNLNATAKPIAPQSAR